MSRLSARSRDWIVAIEGIGGLGKSALAAEVAWRCVENYATTPSDDRFEAVVWATRRPEATHGGERAPEESGAAAPTGLDDVFRAIDELLGPSRMRRLAPQELREEAYRLVSRAGRVLLILDNLEAADDAELPRFLYDLPKGCKSLATLRFHEDMPDPIELSRLSPVATLALLRDQLDERTNIELDPQAAARLGVASWGIPAVVRWVAGLCAESGAEKALDLIDKVGEEPTSGRARGPAAAPPPNFPRIAFDAVVDLMRRRRPDDYFALLACTFFDLRAGVDQSMLARVLDVSREECDQITKRLVARNLLQVDPGGRCTLLPVAYTYLTAQRDRHATWEHDARERWIAAYREHAVRCADPRARAGIERDVPTVRMLMDWLRDHVCERVHALDLALLFDKLQNLVFAHGSWRSLLDWAETLARYVETTPEKNAATQSILVSLLQTPIDIYSRRAEYDEGVRWLRRIRELAQAQQVAAGEAVSVLEAELLLAEARLKYNDGTMKTVLKLQAIRKGMSKKEAEAHLAALLAEATERVTRALGVFRACRRMDQVVVSYVTLGNCYRAASRHADAELQYRDALRVLEKELTHDHARMEPWRAVICGNLALVEGRQGRYLQACDMLRETVPHLVEPTDRVEAYAALALYEYARGNTKDAEEHHEEAERLKEQIGEGEIALCREEDQWAERMTRTAQHWQRHASAN
jgi:hypothetical protein